MAHATHFLDRLGRVQMHHADLALALYRDPERVRYLLYRLPIPPDTERVALALSRDPEPPHVIVSRDGGFVTCLGPGMVVRGAYPVPREHFDALERELRAFREVSAAAEGEGGARAHLDRVFRRATRFSREDYRLVDAWTPVFEDKLWSVLFNTGEIAKRFEAGFRRGEYKRPDAGQRRALRAWWDARWAVGHLTVLLTRHFDWTVERLRPLDPKLAGNLPIFAWPAASSGMLGLVLRSAWASSRMGRHTWDRGLAALREGLTSGTALYHGLGLAALALREPERRAEALAAFQAAAPKKADDGWTKVVIAALVRTLGQTDEVRRRAGELLRVTFPDLEDAERYGIAPALLLTDALFARNPAVAAYLLPGLAEAEAEDLYLPADALAPLEQDPTDDDLIDRLGAMQTYVGTYAPRRAQARPGRNDPCACGSGRKYKHCCA